MIIKLKAPIEVHEIGYPENTHIIKTSDNVEIKPPFLEEYLFILVFETGKKFILYPDQINPRKQDLTKWSLLLARLKLSQI